MRGWWRPCRCRHHNTVRGSLPRRHRWCVAILVKDKWWNLRMSGGIQILPSTYPYLFSFLWSEVVAVLYHCNPNGILYLNKNCNTFWMDKHIT
jgi:hypothetical protein